MSRPYFYKQLDKITKTDNMCDIIALGYDTMWGVKHGDDWVTVCREDAFNFKSTYRTYTRLFFATEKAAQNQVDKLNKMFNSTEYKIAKV